MKTIKYLLSYGIKPTFRRIRSALFTKFIPKKFIQGRYKEKINLSDIPEMTAINTKSNNEEYKKYLNAQIEKSVSYTRYINPAKKFLQSRSTLIESLTKRVKNHRIECDTILSIGSRDENELETISSFFPKSKVSGLDLFSASPKIKVGDMHDMPFEDNSFNITIAIHNMEHSYDPHKSLGEMFRVTKEGGLLSIEVPVNFNTSETDRVDFKNLLNLLSFFKKDSIEVLWSELEGREDFNRASALRVIIQKLNIANLRQE